MTGPTLAPPSSANGPETNGIKSHTIEDVCGYNANVFPGKSEQMLQVCEYLEKSGFIPKELVQNEVTWFYG